MKNFQTLAAVVLALLVAAPSLTFAAESKENKEGKNGNIRVVKVTGTPSLIKKDENSSAVLKEGTFIQDGSTIKTDKDSQAILLFSNGTTLTVEKNSVFSVEKFLQTPFDSNKVDYTKIKSEPSISQTKISVSEGTILADVAKLNKGSTFNVGTPLGVAGIRGTLIQVTVNTTSGGQISVTVNLPEGVADFAATNGKQVTLTNGQTITVSSNPTLGTLTLSGVSPLSAQTIAQIQDLANQAAAAIPAEHVFEGVIDGSPEIVDAAEQDSAGGFGGDAGAGDVGSAPTGGSGGGGGGGGTGGATPTPTPNPPPS